ncbi:MULTISPECIES: ogr/Delta-like zinc finger family protein [Acinetobacter]|uniref:ogr/Delta-like zinc finger family protein n=1 Tax=Acinetobacter TaxID=469 RepID=UPI000F66165C|nr:MULTISPECIES: ogr/Delta-like zinc finger family protein [Acinetobacter]RSC23239.1 transcriptional regulator [Acinetobacter sp. FDAARGOS_515]
MPGKKPLKCPHCGSAFSIRHSEQESPVLRRYRGQCQNLECGFTAIGFMELKFQLSPPSIPNPEIHLPVSDHVKNAGRSTCPTT